MKEEAKDDLQSFVDFLDIMREDIDKLQKEVKLLKENKLPTASEFAKQIINDIKIGSRL